MPKLTHEVPDGIDAELARRDVERIRAVGDKRRREIRRRYRPIDVSNTPTAPGDLTQNSPTLRKDTKVRNRLDLSETTYRTDIGKVGGIPLVIDRDGSVHIKLTLSLLTLYRHHLAAKTSDRHLKHVE